MKCEGRVPALRLPTRRRHRVREMRRAPSAAARDRAVPRATTDCLFVASAIASRVRPRPCNACALVMSPSASYFGAPLGLTVVDAFAGFDDGGLERATRQRQFRASLAQAQLPQPRMRAHGIAAAAADGLRQQASARPGSCRRANVNKRSIPALTTDGRKPALRPSSRASSASASASVEVEHAQMESGSHRRCAREQREHAVLAAELPNLIEDLCRLGISSRRSPRLSP